MSTLKEIFKIASLLDAKGLVSEADILDSAVKDYINKTARTGDRSSNVKTTDGKILNLQTARMKDVVRNYKNHEGFSYTFRFDGFSGNFAFFYAKGIKGEDIDPNEEYHLVIHHNNIPAGDITIGGNLREYNSSLKLQDTKFEEDLPTETTVEKYKIKNTMSPEGAERANLETDILKDLYGFLHKGEEYNPAEPIIEALPDSNNQIKDHKSVPITDKSKLYYFDGIHGSKVEKSLTEGTKDFAENIADLANSYQEGLAFYDSTKKEVVYYEFASNLTLPVRENIKGVLGGLVSSGSLTEPDYQLIGAHLEKLLGTGFFAAKKDIEAKTKKEIEAKTKKEIEAKTKADKPADEEVERSMFFLYTIENSGNEKYAIPGAPGSKSISSKAVPKEIVYLMKYSGNSEEFKTTMGLEEAELKFEEAYDVTGAIIISKLSGEFIYNDLFASSYLDQDIESFTDALVKIKAKSFDDVGTIDHDLPGGKISKAETHASKESYFDEYIKVEELKQGTKLYNSSRAAEFIKGE